MARIRRNGRKPPKDNHEVEALLAGLAKTETPSCYPVRELVALHRAAIRTIAAQRELIGTLGRENVELKKTRGRQA